jgi:IS30 family transposase
MSPAAESPDPPKTNSASGREKLSSLPPSEKCVPVYICDPRSPWQRGSNENTNGRLRQYFPKRSDLKIPTQAHLDAVANELNARPRQTLHWKSPSEALDEAVAMTP